MGAVGVHDEDLAHRVDRRLLQPRVLGWMEASTAEQSEDQPCS